MENFEIKEIRKMAKEIWEAYNECPLSRIGELREKIQRLNHYAQSFRIKE